jgi:hypothetical protein
VHSPEGGAPKGVSTRVFSNLRRRMNEYGNRPLHKQLSFYLFLFISSLLSHFVEKKYFHGNMGTYKIGGAPPAYKALGFSSPLLAVAGWMDD